MPNYWKLSFLEVKPLVQFGKDEHRKKYYLNTFLEMARNIPDFKGLQIGVHHQLNEKHGPRWTSIDKYDKRPCIDHNLDICRGADMAQFGEQFDVVICNAVLEHVKQPFAAAYHLQFALKPGGILYIEIPFAQPYHPHNAYTDKEGYVVETCKATGEHGGDYWRFTPQGAVELFSLCDMIELGLTDEGGVMYVGRKRA